MIRAALAVAAWVCLAGLARAEAPPEATGKPLPIGHVDHAVSPAGFVYTKALGVFGVPVEPTHRRHHPLRPAPRKIAPHTRLTASAH